MLPHQKFNNNHALSRINVLLAIVIGLAVLAIFGSIFYQTHNSLNKMTDHAVIKQDNFDGKKPFNVLLLGSDTGYENRHDKYGNSDTAIIATIVPDKKRVDLVSIPRDTLSQIQNNSRSLKKVNAAFSEGGADLSVKTIANLVNVPIKYYATVNMQGLIRLVNDVGGVDVNVPFSFDYDYNSFHKGNQHLNGRHALAYARMRYDDPEGDYGRQKRQRQIIKALVLKMKHERNLNHINNLINHAGNNVKTNIATASLLAIAQNYRIDSIKSDYLHGKNATIDDLSYQVPATSELQRISDKLRTDLNLPKQPINNAVSYSNKFNKVFFRNATNPTYIERTKNE